MLIDDVKIKVASGHGGKGAVAFDKNKGAIGPCGGNGGKGGNIIFEGVSDLGALEFFRFKKELVANDGGMGHGQFVDGEDGKSQTFKIPIGSIIHNLTTKTDQEIIKIGEQIIIAKGGYGGKGNYKFRSSRNTSPTEFQPGLPGEEFQLQIELKLIADVGFVGLPNVGKSTLLNLLTNAKAKIANYQFTTLEPNLGVYYQLILADIPGLIEGASDGKGLGIKFLKHIERTHVLFHFIASNSEDIIKDYKTIRQELTSYNPELANKEEFLILTKTDEVTPAELKKLLTKAKKINKNTVAISAYDDESLKPIKKILNKIEKEKTT